jgi:signal transduction histidine kinase
LLTTLIENAGAQRAAFLLKDNDQWWVEAEIDENCKVTIHHPHLLLSDYHNLPTTLVDYAIKNEDSLILKNPSRGSLFETDPYLIVRDPKSVLCAPIIRKDQVLAVIYMENNLSSLAFNEERLSVLQVIASQVAITLENARLYAGMEGKVKLRTRELQSALDQLEKQHDRLKATQAQLVHSEKMASLGVLTAGIAHELNNPSNFLKGSADNLHHDLHEFRDMLMDLVQDEDPEFAQVFKDKFTHFDGQLKVVFDGVERIKGIVNDLNIFTRHQEDGRKIVSIVENIQASVNLVQTHYADSVSFRLDIKDDLQIYCDPAELNQVFMNILVNACQAIERKANGSGIVSISAVNKNDYLVIQFQDNGCGMTAETKEKIFEPFFTTQDVGKGTGLGLSMSYGIIQRHKGNIEVETAFGVGTTISISLPVDLREKERLG